jgi:hypothetical protein
LSGCEVGAGRLLTIVTVGVIITVAGGEVDVWLSSLVELLVDGCSVLDVDVVLEVVVEEDVALVLGVDVVVVDLVCCLARS